MQSPQAEKTKLKMTNSNAMQACGLFQLLTLILVLLSKAMI